MTTTFDTLMKNVEHVNSTMNYFKEDVRDLKGEVSKLRSDLKEEVGKLREEARMDFRWLLAIMIGGIVGLAGLMAHGFHWLI